LEGRVFHAEASRRSVCGALLASAIGESARATLPNGWTRPGGKSLGPARFHDAAGKAWTLPDLRGQTLLVNLWATWCAPCLIELPALDRLQADLGGQAFQVVAISLDRRGLPAVFNTFQRGAIRSLIPYIDESGAAADQLGAAGLPASLLIDVQGRLIARRRGRVDWDAPAERAAIRSLAHL
jgi:thiol-disulfide isomerase/thioredoxin